MSKEDDVVSFCRERKCLIKLALERRYAFAEAYSKYNQSLYSLALALRLFVARHSSPSSPLLITYPSTLTSEQHEPPGPHQGETPEGKESKEEEFSDEDEEEPFCEHFYGDVSAPLASPRRSYQWDFFNLFDVGGLTQKTYEDDRVRVGSGTRDVDEIKDTRSSRDDSKLEPCVNDSLRRINEEKDGRELLEALKDVEDYFIKACNSGKTISRMLEANKVPFLSGLDDIKGELYLSVLHLHDWVD